MEGAAIGELVLFPTTVESWRESVPGALLPVVTAAGGTVPPAVGMTWFDVGGAVFMEVAAAAGP